METLKKFLTDGGSKSRKLWLVVFAMVLMIVMAFAACHCPVIAGLYPEIVGGLLGAAGLYITGNVVARNAAAKHLGSKLADDDQQAT